jgi:hypothetical protein
MGVMGENIITIAPAKGTATGLAKKHGSVSEYYAQLDSGLKPTKFQVIRSLGGRHEHGR